MRFGVCTWNGHNKDIEKMSIIKDKGFDYIETDLNTLADMSDDEIDTLKRHIDSIGMKIETGNCFFPFGITLVGPNADASFMEKYVPVTMERFKKLGGEICVVGSGGARNVPEGYSRELAEEQFSDVMRYVSKQGEIYGLKLAIEPLNSGETNFINTVGDCVDFCKKLNLKNVGAHADFFHVYKSGESLDAIENAGKLLFHAHIQRANDDQRAPYEDTDIPWCEKWSAALKKCGYNERLSIEGGLYPDTETRLSEIWRFLDIFK